MAASSRRPKEGVCNVPDESVVEEGLGSYRISRRGLIKAGAIVGGTVWVAPVIDSFTSRAAAQSQLNYCCTCYGGSPDNAFCEEDNSPSTAAMCASDCGRKGYARYIWCQGSTKSYSCPTFAPDNTQTMNPPGLCSGGCAGVTATCCVSGPATS
jgi:hypothetical protein